MTENQTNQDLYSKVFAAAAEILRLEKLVNALEGRRQNPRLLSPLGIELTSLLKRLWNHYPPNQ